MANIIMVKTTIMLEDDLYKDLVAESIEEYGSTRKLSLLINKKLRISKGKRLKRKIHIKPIKLGRRISEKQVESAIEEGWSEAIKWSV